MYTPEERMRALLFFFGWQGGTIHQIAKETDLTVEEILYSEFIPSHLLSGGFSAIRTCSKEWRTNVLAPKERGNLEFYQDVIRGFYATGPLDKMN